MKTFSFKIDPLTGEDYYEVYLRGRQLLNDPFLNKGSAFTKEERLALDLDGRLPAAVSTMETQLHKSLNSFRRKQDDLEKYLFLTSLLDRSEPLFYRLLVENLTEMVPIVYTPTVGLACQQMSRIARRFRGTYINPDNIGHIDRIFQAISQPQVSLIVVTDGERILGLGDLGADGMGIPVGKVSLYVAAGGLHPACCLPVMLDVGTNNETLLNDPLYLGYRHPRLTGQAYEDMVERFVLGVQRNFAGALLQWEDFAKHTAFRNLDRYSKRLLSFNDDIQGTGAVALSVLMTGLRAQKSPFKDNRFVIVGMGQAGSGVARNIRAMLLEEGLSDEEARTRLFALDMPGLLMEDTPGLEEQQLPYAQRRSTVAGWKLQDPGKITLHDVVRNARPTALVGVTAQRGLFDAEILGELVKNAAHPIVLALSNPTSKSECTPEELAAATGGRGLLATGSPFPPLKWEKRTIHTSQCNNLYIFPGLGLGALVSHAPRITGKMMIAASKAISRMVTPTQERNGFLLPEMETIREVSLQVAKAVAIEARNAGLGRVLTDEEYEKVIRKAQWTPGYTAYRPG